MSKIEQSGETQNQVDMSTKVNRRTFLKIIGGLGVTAAAMTLFSPLPLKLPSMKAFSSSNQSSTKYSLKRTVCLQCHSACGVQVTITDPGTSSEQAINISGNPYHPSSLLPHLDYDTDPTTLVNSEGYPIYSGRICAKGRAGLQILYDSHRLKHPLKRVGPRGSGKWEVITWEQALDEICGVDTNGSNIVGNLPTIDGSTTYTYDGLKQIRENDPNKFVFMVGRSEHGRKELTDRLWKTAYGTKNHRNDHTSICEQSHHVAFSLAFPGKTHVGTDIMNAEFILWVGTSPLEAGFPMMHLTQRLMAAKNARDNPLKMVVVDPRFSKTAAKADMWLPVRPGADAALACGMLAYMMEQGWYNETFLRNANVDTAKAGNPKEWVATDATHLVIVQSGHTNERKFLTADVIAGSASNHVITTDGTGGTATEVTGSSAIGHLGDLTLLNYKTSSINVGGNECKTVFQLLKEKLWEPVADSGGTIEDLLNYYSDECGEYVSVGTIKDLATQFWKHGKKSVCNFYRGSVQHTNGTYTALALIYLNYFVGNIDRRGGMTTGGSHWHEMGGKSTTPYDLSSLFGGTPASTSGLNIAREKVSYSSSWLGAGSPTYPAERPFFPLTSNVWQEVIAGIRHGEGSNPSNTGFYQPLAVWFHMANPNYSMPGSQLATEMLLDEDPNTSNQYKVPLAISTELVMGETSTYVDYILPDVSYLERYATPHVAPNQPIKVSGIRQPVISSPLYPNTKSAEEVYLEVAARLGLPGFGDNGFGTPAATGLPDGWTDLNTPEDWYNKMFVNFAIESEKVPKAGGGFYTIDDWNAASNNASTLQELEEELVNYVFARGGVFNNADTGYDGADDKNDNEFGEYMAGRWGKQVYFYIEKLAREENCMATSAGEYFDGIGHYERIKNAAGVEIRDKDKTTYPYQLITYKTVLHTQSRTIACDWLTQLEGTNGLLINEDDAANLGIKNGDKITVSSRTVDEVTGVEPLETEAIITKGIMKGVVGVSHCFGHFAYGSKNWTETEDGSDSTIKGIPSRNRGISINPILRLDESLNNSVCLQDLIGGSACFYDTYVKIEKA